MPDPTPSPLSSMDRTEEPTKSLHSQSELTPAHSPLPAPGNPAKKGSAFWLTLLALVVSTLLAALDLTAIGNIMPTLIQDLHGQDNFAWVGSAYALSSAAVLPLVGGLSDIFGRRPVLLVCNLCFCVGSALAGAAQNMPMMIAARTIQGFGGGGIPAVTSIVISDLVPLAERGTYQGLIGLTYALASAVGPIISGVLTQKASWRWLFYINLPISGISVILVIFFLRVRTPEGSLKEKIAKIDWFGNIIIIAGTTLAAVALTYAGTRFSWDSVKVLVLLIVGLTLIVAFVIYEAYIPKRPTIPFKVLNNTTTISGYIAAYIHGIISISLIYYLPVFFQASMNATPIRSSILLFPTAFLLAPFSFIAPVLIKITQKYLIMNIVGWVMITAGLGIASLMHAHMSVAQNAGFQVVVAIGTGIVFGCTFFPILAPLQPESSAYALSFFSFLRQFGFTWGVTISGTILQNQLKKRLPAAFLQKFPEGVEIAFAAIPQIRTLPEPLKSEVEVAFAESMSVVWKAMAGIASIGLLAMVLMREIPMTNGANEKYGLEDKADKRKSRIPDAVEDKA